MTPTSISPLFAKRSQIFFSKSGKKDKPRDQASFTDRSGLNSYPPVSCFSVSVLNQTRLPNYKTLRTPITGPSEG